MWNLTVAPDLQPHTGRLPEAPPQTRPRSGEENGALGGRGPCSELWRGPSLSHVRAVNTSNLCGLSIVVSWQMSTPSEQPSEPGRREMRN